MIHVQLPDGASRALSPSSTAADLAAAISPSLAKKTVAAVVDGQLRDLTAPLSDGAAVELVTRDDPRVLELIRHDLAHVLADPALEGIASYVVPIDIIDTDRVRLDTYNQGTNESLNQASVAYPETHGTDQDCGVQNLPGQQIDAQGNERPRGYAAPPLYGVWATAPYLHNGSVPDVWSLLDSSERPATWRRISKQPRADQAGQVVMGYETDFERGYDPQRMGWRYEELNCDPSPSADYLSCNPLNDLGDFFLSEVFGGLLLGWNIANPPILTNSDIEARKIYNPRLFSQGNGGHVFSDVLNDAERAAIIEYLKTL